eukprot:scaffold1599_cov68-Phaeocystis_antarctica.AAC.2
MNAKGGVCDKFAFGLREPMRAYLRRVHHVPLASRLLNTSRDAPAAARGRTLSHFAIWTAPGRDKDPNSAGSSLLVQQPLFPRQHTGWQFGPSNGPNLHAHMHRRRKNSSLAVAVEEAVGPCSAELSHVVGGVCGVELVARKRHRCLHQRVGAVQVFRRHQLDGTDLRAAHAQAADLLGFDLRGPGDRLQVSRRWAELRRHAGLVLYRRTEANRRRRRRIQASWWKPSGRRRPRGLRLCKLFGGKARQISLAARDVQVGPALLGRRGYMSQVCPPGSSAPSSWGCSCPLG